MVVEPLSPTEGLAVEVGGNESVVSDAFGSDQMLYMEQKLARLRAENDVLRAEIEELQAIVEDRVMRSLPGEQLTNEIAQRAAHTPFREIGTPPPYQLATQLCDYCQRVGHDITQCGLIFDTAGDDLC